MSESKPSLTGSNWGLAVIPLSDGGGVRFDLTFEYRRREPQPAIIW